MKFFGHLGPLPRGTATLHVRRRPPGFQQPDPDGRNENPDPKLRSGRESDLPSAETRTRSARSGPGRHRRRHPRILRKRPAMVPVEEVGGTEGRIAADQSGIGLLLGGRRQRNDLRPRRGDQGSARSSEGRSGADRLRFGPHRSILSQLTFRSFIVFLTQSLHEREQK